MNIFGLVALAALQVTHSLACVDNDQIVSSLDPHQQPGCHPPAAPQCPCRCEGVPEGPCNYCLQYPCGPQPYIQQENCPCNQSPSEPCIRSVTRVASLPCGSPEPVLQSAVQCPLFPEPLVPVVENHVGHHLIKTVKRVPVIRKYCRPELVIRTRQVPVVKHRKRVFIEPYSSLIPVTDKLIRQVIHEITHRVPFVHKTLRPFTYQTIRHVPLSCAQSAPGEPAPFPCNQPCNPQNCHSLDHLPQPNFPVGCNAPYPGLCDGTQPPSPLPTTCFS